MKVTANRTQVSEIQTGSGIWGEGERSHWRERGGRYTNLYVGQGVGLILQKWHLFIPTFFPLLSLKLVPQHTRVVHHLPFPPPPPPRTPSHSEVIAVEEESVDGGSCRVQEDGVGEEEGEEEGDSGSGHEDVCPRVVEHHVLLQVSKVLDVSHRDVCVCVDAVYVVIHQKTIF